MMGNLFITYNYMLPLFFALAIGIYVLISLLPKKEVVATAIPIDNLDKPFNNKLSNQLYELSFKPPFVWFIPENPESKPAKELDQRIAKAKLTEVFNFRIVNTLQTVLMMIAVFITIVFGFVIQNSSMLIKFLFNFSIDPESQNVIFMLIGAIMMIASLTPKLYINSRARSLENEFYTNLPILQQFVLIMIRSQRSIGEIYNVLAYSELPYNEIFRVANLVYVRDRVAASDYLEGVFHGTPFYETILILRSFDEYGIEQSIESLKRRNNSILSEVQSMKKSKGVIKGLITEGSIILPFSAVMLLGAFPVVWWSMQMLNGAMSMT